MILPETGRWQREALTEGAHPSGTRTMMPSKVRRGVPPPCFAWSPSPFRGGLGVTNRLYYGDNLAVLREDEDARKQGSLL